MLLGEWTDPELSLSTETQAQVLLCSLDCKFFKWSQLLLYDKQIMASSFATKEKT